MVKKTATLFASPRGCGLRLLTGGDFFFFRLDPQLFSNQLVSDLFEVFEEGEVDLFIV